VSGGRRVNLLQALGVPATRGARRVQAVTKASSPLDQFRNSPCTTVEAPFGSPPEFGDPERARAFLAPRLISGLRMNAKLLLIFSFLTPMLIGSLPSAAASPHAVVVGRSVILRPVDELKVAPSPVEVPLAQGRPEYSRGTTVHCGPNRRAVVRPIRLNGRRAERIVCVGTARAVARRAHHRSLKKSALVIGGSTAAGAGVGALVGGGKGAVIGGLAGGAAGSAYEIHKRRKVRRHRASR
jgi:hypothetical protein